MLPFSVGTLAGYTAEMDAIACEPHFLDHLAPVWRSLPDRGRFLVDAPLLGRARRKGIDAEAIPAQEIREAYRQQAPPRFDGPPALVASIGDVKVARRLGYGPFVFLEHGAGQYYGGKADDRTHASYSGGADHDDVGLFLVPNETVGDRWRIRYPKARVAVVGCPKIDSLPRRSGGGPPVVAVSFHWPAPAMIGWGLAGTAWHEYKDALPALAARFRVIGHQHPNWLQRGYGKPPSQTYERLGIPFVEDFEDVCAQADVYVCDNSSTIWEFAAMGRPVVLLNREGWIKARGRVRYGLRFWDEADVGIQVDRPADLVSAVEEALADEPAQQIAREAAVNRVYGLRTNGAAAAATAIVDWLASREEVAA
jgi:hypothetical protein